MPEQTIDEILRGAKAALDSAARFSSDTDRMVAEKRRSGTIGKGSKYEMLHGDIAASPVGEFGGKALDLAGPAALLSSGPAGASIAALQGIRAAAEPGASALGRAVNLGISAIPGLRSVRKAAPVVEEAVGVAAPTTQDIVANFRRLFGKGRAAESKFVNQAPEVIEDAAPAAQEMVGPADIDSLISQLRTGAAAIPSKAAPAQRAASFIHPTTQRGAMDARIADIVARLRGQ